MLHKKKTDTLAAIGRVVAYNQSTLATLFGDPVLAQASEHEWKIGDEFTTIPDGGPVWRVTEVDKPNYCLCATSDGINVSNWHVTRCHPVVKPATEEEIAHATESLQAIAEELNEVFYEYRVWSTRPEQDVDASTWCWDAQSSDGKWRNTSEYPRKKRTAEADACYACFEQRLAEAVRVEREAAPWERYENEFDSE